MTQVQEFETCPYAHGAALMTQIGYGRIRIGSAGSRSFRNDQAGTLPEIDD